MDEATDWREVYDGGSPEAENESFLHFADMLGGIQEATRRKAGWDHPRRTLHARQTIGIEDARLIVHANMPARFRQGHFAEAQSLAAVLRFSNASATCQPDSTPDMRGIAIRLTLPSGGIHDLLMTSFPVSHARNARQFVDFAVIASSCDRTTLVPRLVAHFGEAEATRMLSNVQQAARRSPGLAFERFWSRGAFLWGAAGPVRFNLRPLSQQEFADAAEPEDLRANFAARLRLGDVAFRLAVQMFVDETDTPIEDGAVEWREAVTPSIDIATLIIPARKHIDPDASARVDALSFNPWNAPTDFRPLGNLNRARGVAYDSSAARWGRGRLK
ncbi:MAG: hypothetical protein ABW175_25365 [Bradyrhizobium sp.]